MKRRAAEIPGWMAFVNGAHPIVRRRLDGELEVQFVERGAVGSAQVRRQLSGGWIDAMQAPGASALYLSMFEMVDALLCPSNSRLERGKPSDAGRFERVRDAYWSACLHWFDTTRSPVSVRDWPRWLTTLRINGRFPARSGGRAPDLSFVALRFHLRRNLPPDEVLLGTIAADFLCDLTLLRSAAAESGRLARCTGCARLMIRTSVRRPWIAPNERRRAADRGQDPDQCVAPAAHGAEHLFCGDTCRKGWRAHIEGEQERARESRGSAVSESEPTKSP